MQNRGHIYPPPSLHTHTHFFLRFVHSLRLSFPNPCSPALVLRDWFNKASSATCVSLHPRYHPPRTEVRGVSSHTSARIIGCHPLHCASRASLPSCSYCLLPFSLAAWLVAWLVPRFSHAASSSAANSSFRLSRWRTKCFRTLTALSLSFLTRGLDI